MEDMYRDSAICVTITKITNNCVVRVLEEKQKESNAAKYSKK